MGALRAALEVESAYSAVLTDEQREAIDARALTAPDWALFSLKPFTSDETLAVAMTNGESDGSATWTLNSDGTVTLTDGTGTLPENSYIDDSGVLHLALDADDGTMWILCKK